MDRIKIMQDSHAEREREKERETPVPGMWENLVPKGALWLLQSEAAVPRLGVVGGVVCLCLGHVE